jgi:hypothetical protein
MALSCLEQVAAARMQREHVLQQLHRMQAGQRVGKPLPLKIPSTTDMDHDAAAGLISPAGLDPLSHAASLGPTGATVSGGAGPSKVAALMVLSNGLVERVSPSRQRAVSPVAANLMERMHVVALERELKSAQGAKPAVRCSAVDALPLGCFGLHGMHVRSCRPSLRTHNHA